MNIEEWLYAKLLPLLPTDNGGVHGGMAPPGTDFPYIVFKEVSSVKEYIDAESYWFRDRWQVDIYTEGNYTVGRTLLASVKQILDVRGSDNGLCIFTTETDSEDMYDENVELHYQSLDYLLTYAIEEN